jgi:6-phosphofructokinase 1
MAIKRIAVLTSGGDAPGMNPAIRAVVRIAIDLGLEVFGVRHGYAGLCDGLIEPMTARSVGGIIQRGGTILGSARCDEFKTEAGRRKALRNLAQEGIDGLVVIGGNGSQAGAYAMPRMGYPVMGVASTIDNDLVGSDLAIGVDTALNTALEAIDRLKDTAISHQRAFLVEVMGRECGYLALMTAIAGGAETVIIPEIEADLDKIASELAAAYVRGKSHALLVVAEGARYNAAAVASHFEEHREEIGFDLRVTVLGHVQRGGSPLAFDRILATRLGAAAAELMAQGEHGKLVGIINNTVTATPYEEVVGKRKSMDPYLYELSRVLAK